MDEDHRISRAAAPAKCGDVAEELAYRLRQQKLTAAFGEYALRARDVTDMLQEASRVCALGLNSQFCKVMEYLPAEGRFLVKSGVGWRDGVVGHARVGADAESPTGYAFQTGDPVISNHLSKETRFRTPSLLAEHGIRRAINVLIQGDGDRDGVYDRAAAAAINNATTAGISRRIIGRSAGRRMATRWRVLSDPQYAAPHKGANGPRRRDRQRLLSSRPACTSPFLRRRPCWSRRAQSAFYRDPSRSRPDWPACCCSLLTRSRRSV